MSTHLDRGDRSRSQLGGTHRDTPEECCRGTRWASQLGWLSRPPKRSWQRQQSLQSCAEPFRRRRPSLQLRSSQTSALCNFRPKNRNISPNPMRALPTTLPMPKASNATPLNTLSPAYRVPNRITKEVTTKESSPSKQKTTHTKVQVPNYAFPPQPHGTTSASARPCQSHNKHLLTSWFSTSPTSHNSSRKHSKQRPTILETLDLCPQRPKNSS